MTSLMTAPSTTIRPVEYFFLFAASPHNPSIICFGFSIIKKERGVLGEVKSRGCVRHALYARVGCEVPISLSLSDEHVAVLLLGGGERGPRA